MIKQLHEHILDELRTNIKIDTIFVITAIVFNLITLGINSAIASEKEEPVLIMFIFVSLIIVINIVSEIGLNKGRQAQTKLINGLLKIYKDNNIDQYYDPSLLKTYRTRYNLFILIVLFTGIVAIIVPFISM
ncbi:MAG: hypothetical protein HN952_07150 [Candidatus Cloacimonetes bacterium]|jgi:hypothetical protein|nr:hypothetical protein [Candidatus Cloacimonadota bacterium]MBT5420781.1 hypothetical protein [Candidatus Cloacimonadota bacterium]MBT6994711.1 hypothetical protein [Candidatus Cloacimonadota bacterium]MBT7469815.1 hypothetical protein [Candidatus Cloacimonadota bacterium]